MAAGAFDTGCGHYEYWCLWADGTITKGYPSERQYARRGRPVEKSTLLDLPGRPQTRESARKHFECVARIAGFMLPLAGRPEEQEPWVAPLRAALAK